MFRGARAAAGVSGLVRAVSGFPDAYRQARFALSAAAGSAAAVAVFEELGVVQFLLAPAERTDLDQFAQRVVGPLLEHDRVRRSELVRTLDAYLSANCHLQRSSDRLFIHHKTMRYRLHRIQELTGLRLDHQEDRFNAQLALKILGLGAPGANEPSPRSSALR
jgi:DNA-binding PucR family transcriptional regulator